MRAHPLAQRRRSKIGKWFTAALAAMSCAAVMLVGVDASPAAAALPPGAPASPPTPIFTIGTPDQSDAEFALAPSHYEDYSATFPDDVNFTVGTSTEAHDWSYIQPGPGDAWAGKKVHPFTINYDLAAVPATDLLLQLSYTDSSSASTTVEVDSNGVAQSASLPPGGNTGAFGVGYASGTTSSGNKPQQIGFLIPASSLKAGANKLVIKNTNSYWTTYDSVSLAPAAKDVGSVQILATNPTVLFKNDAQQGQLVDLQVDNTSSTPSNVTFTASANHQQIPTGPVSVPAGVSTQRVEVPPAPAGSPIPLEITTASQDSGFTAGDFTTMLPYQRRWQIDMLNGSHLDIGYHYDQATTRQLQDSFLDQAVAQCQATSDYAPNEQYRWSIEHSWMLDNYIQDRTPAQVNALGACVKSGHLDVPASWDNNLQDLASNEQLIRSMGKGAALAKKFGVSATTAIEDDPTGVTAQNIQMLARQGVKLLINGSNPDHTGRWTTPHTSQDSPALFNWQAPDGSKVLTFFGAHVYDEGYQWDPTPGLNNKFFKKLAPWSNNDSSTHPLPYTPITAPPITSTTIPYLASTILNPNIQGLQVSKYPQSVYPLMFFEDSNPPMVGLSDVVKAYDQQYSWPKLVISTSSMYAQDASTHPGATSPDGYRPDPTSLDASQLPVKHGDYTGWWSDGAGSSAYETGENMQAQSRTTSAETLGALASVQAPDPNSQCLVDSAYQEEELYTEHTWASPSLLDPDPQWAVKKTHADKAGRLSQDAMGSAVTSLGKQVANTSTSPGLAVFNSLSWQRSDVVTATVPAGWAGQLWDVGSNTAVPYESVSSAEIRFLAADVPALGYRTYELRAGTGTATSADPSLGWTPGTDSAPGILQNQYYKVSVDANTGVVTSIINKATGRELVDQKSAFKLNQYVYRPNPRRDGHTTDAQQWSPAHATVTLKSSGPVSTTIAITYPDTANGKDASGKATGVNSAGATLTLYAGVDRLDIADSIDKTKVTTPEEGYFAFPFKQDNPTVTYEAPGTSVQLADGQMPGAAMDWQSVRSYADLSSTVGDTTSGVTLSTPNAPLMEFGHIRSMELQPRPGRLDDTATPDLTSVRPTNGSAFSYAFNSLWQTNYRLYQSGPITYNYSITDHTGAFDATAATRYGWGVQTPLQPAAVPASQAGTYPAGATSLMSVVNGVRHPVGNLVVQTFKQANATQQTASPSGLPLTARLLEVAGKSGTARLHLPFKVTKAQLENLTEDPSGAALKVTDSGTGSDIQIHYTGHEIITVGLQPANYTTQAPLVCATEFALAPNGYASYSSAFPNDVDYTAQQDTGFTTGVSYPSDTTPYVSATGTGVAAPQWSYIQPGPTDIWAGSKQHTFKLNFDLADAPTKDLTLSLWLLDTQDLTPPTIRVALNAGTGQSIQLPAGGGDGYRFGDGASGEVIKPSTQTITLPATELKKGQNTVAITTTAGSWLAYDGFAIGG
ncbi:polysaccharide lyase family protein [Streptomyces sp. NPDC020917]|uniref:polysaccharide lyase family protein n=1 Tax=Streptomyces sp. NPDC020917 TaxID=3365102 RepID=UPI003788A489